MKKVLILAICLLSISPVFAALDLDFEVATDTVGFLVDWDNSQPGATAGILSTGIVANGQSGNGWNIYAIVTTPLASQIRIRLTEDDADGINAINVASDTIVGAYIMALDTGNSPAPCLYSQAFIQRDNYAGYIAGGGCIAYPVQQFYTLSNTFSASSNVNQLGFLIFIDANNAGTWRFVIDSWGVAPTPTKVSDWSEYGSKDVKMNEVIKP